jgi:mannonate dehydratase
VHFRDVDGTPEKFHETFHDNGPTDMVRMLEVYSKAGFVGPIRPDHAPARAGEAQYGRATGYTMGGKVFAFGYMKGIMDSLGLKVRLVVFSALSLRSLRLCGELTFSYCQTARILE